MIVLQKGKSYFSVALVNQKTDYTEILSVAVPISFFFITEEDYILKRHQNLKENPVQMQHLRVT